ncbi:hypothetical protein F5Y14DRAFT_237714 [Nemania sp. NC0429]|nr:hypothetical protein F5Y14DRAFT_237714 [Nemania sp. NC0429]
MLLPIDDSVLQSNPRFEKLYNTITTSILNPDGSTKIDPCAKQRDAVRQELKAYRLKAARVQLLRAALSTAIPQQQQQQQQHHHHQLPRLGQHEKGDGDEAEQQQQKRGHVQHRRTKSRPQPPTPSLPPDLTELLILLPPFLNNASTLLPSSVTLLLASPPFTSLPALFPQIVDIVSARLTAQAKALARVLSPTTNPSYVHRVIPSLPSIASTLAADLAALRLKLSRARLATTTALTRHLHRHTEALAVLLRALEAKHGPVSASSELRALDARQEAQAWALASEALLWETRRQAYPPEARAALANYRQHLRDAGRRLEDGARVREAELADYGVDVGSRRRDSRLPGRERRGTTTASTDKSKERTMREMARLWREMETRLNEIRGDLNRLR